MKALLLELVSGSRAEDACLQYELHQAEGDENLFIFHEEWASAEGLQEHNTQPHIQKFITASMDIIDGQIIIYKTQKLA
jgi:quinol monooxygenase YgiN